MTLGRRSWMAAAAVAWVLAACGKTAGDSIDTAHKFKGVDITGAEYGRELALPDPDGKTRKLAEFKGKVTLVFFGYTQCPDVCPTTMAELAQVKKSLGAQGDKVQGVFVSLDPERDKPEVLRPYVSAFDPSFVALRGDAAQTAEAAKEFKIFFAKVPGRTEGSYSIDHTAGSYVFDTKGRLRLFVRYNTPPEDLAADIKALLAAG